MSQLKLGCLVGLAVVIGFAWILAWMFISIGYGINQETTSKVPVFLLVSLIIGLVGAVPSTLMTINRKNKTRLELDASNPFHLITGTGDYQLNTIRGRVAGYHRQLETVFKFTTTTSLRAGGSDAFGNVSPSVAESSQSVQSHTRIHDMFFVVDESGKETSIHLVNWDVSVMDGQMVSMVSAHQDGKWAPYVLMRNHNTQMSKWPDSWFREASAPSVSVGGRGLLMVIGLPLIIIPLITLWIQNSHFNKVIGSFLPSGLYPLIQALDTRAPKK
jgi:hypothetical protein